MQQLREVRTVVAECTRQFIAPSTSVGCLTSLVSWSFFGSLEQQPARRYGCGSKLTLTPPRHTRRLCPWKL